MPRKALKRSDGLTETTGGPDPVTVHTVRLDALKPSPSNPRKHGDRNRSAVSASLQAFGTARSAVVDKDFVIRAGNETVRAALESGKTRARVVDAGPDELVVVRRADWSEAMAEAYEVADNQTGALAEWDPTALSAKLQAMPKDLAPASGFSPEETRQLYDRIRQDRLAEQVKGMAAQAPPGLTAPSTAPTSSAPDPGPAPGKAPSAPGQDYKTFTAVLDPGQYADVMEALQAARKEAGLDRTPEALALIAREYVESHT
jgi:hypothetical protein